MCYNKNSTTEFNIVPINIHGLNLPNLLLVLSTIIPMIGSFMASHNLAIKNNVPTNAGLIPTTSVK